MLSTTRYSYTDIIAITGHFREKLGQGGFGSVFRGTLLNGQHVAIKMLGNYQFNGEDFINEVSTIGRIHHVNIVRLIGFCSEGSKRALVYEYMPKGSLDKYIFSARGTSNRPFSWDKLNEIALGVARGIDYLHRGCDMQILHFDIKSHNILLDCHFNPKVSDFGLAKLYPKNYSLVSLSAARGTIGYIAPELVSRNFGVVSDKSDVYSFGMLLLEMAGGRRNVDNIMANTSQVYYPSWIYDQLTQNNGIIEINNNIEIYEVERKLCKVGLWCIQMKSSNRPSMDQVVEMLEGDTDNLQMPPRPFFASSQLISASQSSMQSISIELSIILEQEDCSNSDNNIKDVKFVSSITQS
ncbi:rust resistance kinase Lr10-like isoform X2 [Ananas comosus]|nr:rust resistance kinase Lr10-like isoform X2 [Ananas comosus]